MMITLLANKNLMRLLMSSFILKPSKQTFCQKLINIGTMPFCSDDIDKFNDSSHGVIPIKSSSKSSNMVIYDNPL